jgi:hypothetical protein
MSACNETQNGDADRARTALWVLIDVLTRNDNAPAVWAKQRGSAFRGLSTAHFHRVLPAPDAMYPCEARLRGIMAEI